MKDLLACVKGKCSECATKETEIFHNFREVRRLVIPPHMAYGDSGVPGAIPGMETWERDQNQSARTHTYTHTHTHTHAKVEQLLNLRWSC